jgi:hypothetical protein
MGESRNSSARGVLRENLKEIDHLEELDIECRIILKFMLKECNERMWIECIWLREGSSDGLL